MLLTRHIKTASYLIIISVTLLSLTANLSFAGLKGNLGFSYMSHDVEDRLNNIDSKASTMTQNYSSYYENKGKILNSLFYGGYVGIEIIGLTKNIPSGERFLGLNSVDNGTEYKYRPVYSGTVDYLSPFRWLPLFVEVSSNDTTPVNFERSNLPMTMGVEQILPVDFPININTPKRTNLNIVANLGYRTSKQQLVRPGTTNIALSRYEDLMDSEYTKKSLWEYLPYISTAYKTSTTKTENAWWKQEDEENNFRVSAGKDNFWAHYRTYEYKNLLMPDTSWSEKKYEIGTISESGYRGWLDLPDHQMKVSPILQYSERTGRDPSTTLSTSFYTDSKIYVPTFLGWREGDLKTFFNGEIKQEKSGEQGKYTEYRLPIYYTYSSDSVDERIRFERNDYRYSSSESKRSNESNRFSWGVDIFRDREFIVYPRISFDQSKNGNGYGDEFITNLSLSTSSTNKYSSVYGLNLGIDYTNSTANKSNIYKLTGRLNGRIDNRTTFYIDQSAIFTKKPVVQADYTAAGIEMNNSEFTTSASLSYVPHNRVTLSLSSSVSIANSTLYKLNEFQKPTTADSTPIKYYVSNDIRYKDANLSIDFMNRFSSEDNSSYEKQSRIISYVGTNNISYLPSRSLELGLNSEFTYRKNDLVRQIISLKQRNIYRYYGNLRREYFNIGQYAEYTKDTTQTEYYTTTENKSFNVNLNIYPIAKTVVSARVAYADTSISNVLSYGVSAALDTRLLNMSIDYQVGQNNLGRSESKLSFNISKSF